MEIKLCGQVIDFTLENEKNVLQVVESMEDWLTSKQQLITELKVNGTHFGLNNREQLEDMSISSTNLIEIEAYTDNEWAIICLMEAKEYISRFKFQLENNENDFFKDKQEKIDGLMWIVEVILGSCKILVVNPEEVFYKDIALCEVISAINISILAMSTKKHNKQYLITEWKEKIITDLNDLYNLIDKMVQNYITTLHDNGENINLILHKKLKEQLELIDIIISKLDEISTNFLSGKEKDAYEQINKIFSMINNLIATLKTAKDFFGIDFNTLKVSNTNAYIIDKEFLQILNEIHKALESKNVVLLSDLLEYELSSKLINYKEILNRILKFYEN